MTTTYELIVTRTSTGSLDRDGGLAPQYECVLRFNVEAGISGPVSVSQPVANYAEWVDDQGFKILDFPEIDTNVAGQSVARFAVEYR
jgi:hypothetical protein